MQYHNFDSPTSIGPDEVTQAAADGGDPFAPPQPWDDGETPMSIEQEEESAVPSPDGPLVLAEGVLDIDELDAATRGLGDRFAESIGRHVHAVRAERQKNRDNPDAPYATAEVAPLVRQLMHGADVLRRIAREYTEAAGVCEEFIADEAMSTGSARVAVPDDDGETEIVVGPKTKASTWAKPRKLGAVVAEVDARRVDVDEYLATADGDAEAAVVAAFRDGTENGFAAVERFGKVSWRTTDAQKFAAELMQAAEDKLATEVERSMGRQTEELDEMAVKREAFKAGRRR